MQLNAKLMNQTWEKYKKPNFRPDFRPHCYKLSLYAISRKINKPNLRKWQKPSFRPDFGHLVQIQAVKYFFSKICLCQSLEVMVSYHHVPYQKKTNDPILRKPSDGRKSDFIGCCLTKVEHPTIKNRIN